MIPGQTGPYNSRWNFRDFCKCINSKAASQDSRVRVQVNPQPFSYTVFDTYVQYTVAHIYVDILVDFY